MNIPGRARIALACACLAIAASASAAAWQPARPVEIVVPTTPGGGIDRTARALQRIFQENGLVSVPVSVVNKPGAGGALSLVYLNQHAGDAHHIAINSPNLIANDINGRSTVKYRDVTPLANLFSEYTVIAVRADSPIRTVQDFIDRLRKDPGSVAVPTPTTLGSVNHMSFALVARAAGVDVKKLKAVVLGSGGDAVTALLGGHIEGRPYAPTGAAWDAAMAYWKALPSDGGAAFDREVAVKADRIAPMVSGKSAGVGRAGLEDGEGAGRARRARSRVQGSRLRMARAGVLAVHGDQLRPGERCASSNRNFRGRQAPAGARTC